MDDLIRELGKVRRRVGTAAGPSETPHVVELRRTYDAPAADVWSACTEPDRIRRWFAPVTGDLRLGGRYQVEGNAGGEITECRAPGRLALTWVFGDDVSTVELDLVPLDDHRTELTLRHTVSDGDHWTTYGPGAPGVGWDLAFLGLGLFLVGAEPASDPSLLTSPEGLAFMRGSAEAWGEAHESSGAPPTPARDAAARTSAAYAPDPEGTPS